MNYYFLGTLLPDLKIGEPPEIGFREFNQLMYDNLSSADYAKISMMRNYYDIYNLRSYWKGDAFDPLGNFDFSGLEEELVTRAKLPWYIYQFLDKYETKEERLRHYPELLAIFFREEIKHARGGVKKYLIAERDIRLILLAFRAKQLGRDVVQELQYEDPEDEIVAQILAQKDSAEYEPPEKYADLKGLLNQYANDPLALQKALAEYRFNKIDEILGHDLFSSDRMLGYLAQLFLVERWQRLDKQKGLEIVNSMLNLG